MTKYTESEDKIQADCFLWLRNTYRFTYGKCFHVPNGKRRTPREAAILKAMGVVKGIPDLFLSIPMLDPVQQRIIYYGLYIEMKTPKGSESKDQLEIHLGLRNEGYKVVTCISLIEFQKEVNDYLENYSYLH